MGESGEDVNMDLTSKAKGSSVLSAKTSKQIIADNLAIIKKGRSASGMDTTK